MSKSKIKSLLISFFKSGDLWYTGVTYWLYSGVILLYTGVTIFRCHYV